MMTNPPSLVDGIVGLFLIALFFYVTRAFFLWYFRINKVIELLSSIDKKLGPSPECDPGETRPELPKSIGALRERVGRFMPGGFRR